MASAFEPYIKKSDWSSLESRVVRNTDKILDLLSEFNVKATFFSVGWVGEKFPALVRRVQSMGHEIACHGFFHRLIYDQTPAEFREDVRRAKNVLESVTGSAVLGYRAPSFSLNQKTTWAWTILEEEGFSYDASVLPAPHARGGFQGMKRFPFRVNNLAEFPMSTLRFGKRTYPFSGGGYFRLLPYRVVRYGINACLDENKPAIVYLHPWEFDPDQPRLQGKLQDKWKHYLNLDKTESKFRRLLTDFRFDTVRNVLARTVSLPS
jgi:polysaccharide deacetylase family protein (PEP-CTERM system associated)